MKVIKILNEDLERKRQKLSPYDQGIIKDIFDAEFNNGMNEIYNFKHNEIKRYDNPNIIKSNYLFEGKQKQYQPYYGKMKYENEINIGKFPQRKITNEKNYINLRYENEVNEEYIKKIIEELRIYIYKRKNNNNIYDFYYLNKNNYEKELIIKKLQQFLKYCYNFDNFKFQNKEKILRIIDYLSKNFMELREDIYNNYIVQLYYELNEFREYDNLSGDKYRKEKFYSRNCFSKYDDFDDFK